MKKDALLNIIINDLKEVEQLMESFRGEDSVNPAFVNLAKTKIKSIEDELSLLNEVFGKTGDEKLSTVKKEKPVPVKEEPVQPEKKMENVAEKVVEKPVVEVKKEDAVIAEVKEPEKEIIEEEVKKKTEPEKETVTAKQEVKAAKGPVKKSIDENARLGDVLQKDKSALNERVARKDSENEIIFTKPVKDVRKAMGINDRFFYQRELFDGNADLFNQTLDQINSMNSFDDAKNFLISNFKWDKESDTTETFLKIVKRRFL